MDRSDGFQRAMISQRSAYEIVVGSSEISSGSIDNQTPLLTHRGMPRIVMSESQTPIQQYIQRGD